MSVRESFANGVTWLGGGLGAVRALAFVQTILLARLLTPEDFGSFGMAALGVGFLTAMTGLGINEALVQSKERSAVLLDTAFTIALLRSWVVFALVWYAAPPMAMLFGTPEVEPLARMLALAIPVRGLKNVGTALFSKDLDYRRLAVYGTLTTWADAVFAVGLAFWLRNAWALALAPLCAAIATLPYSYWIQPHRPRLRAPRREAEQLLRYGVNILSSAPLFFAASRLDDAAVARFFGSRALGVYQVAFGLASAPATHLTEFLANVLFPIFARSQSSPEVLRTIYRQMLRHVAGICFPLVAFLGVFSSPLIRIVYGEPWADAAPIVTAFTLYGGLRSLGILRHQIFRATGHTHWLVHLGALNLAMTVGAVVLGSPFGPTGIAYALGAIAVPLTLYGFRLIDQAIGVRVGEAVRDCAPATLAAAAGAAAALASTAFLADERTVIQLALGGTALGVTHISLLHLLDRSWIPELRELRVALRQSFTGNDAAPPAVPS